MAKNQPKSPFITSVSSTLKKTVQPDTQIVNPDEIKKKKQEMMGIVDGAMKLFMDNLQAGKVSMTTSADLERLVKLQLLLSGEADSRAGKPYGETEQEVSATTQASISMSKIDSILNMDDPDVKNMFDRLYEGYNEQNDVDD